MFNMCSYECIGFIWLVVNVKGVYILCILVVYKSYIGYIVLFYFYKINIIYLLD